MIKFGKNSTGQGDDYQTILLDYSCFNKNYKMIAIDFSKQKAVDNEPKAMH